MNEDSESIAAARRRFLAGCGHFAVATPPAMNLVASGARQSFSSAPTGGAGSKENGHAHRIRRHHPHQRRRYGKYGPT